MDVRSTWDVAPTIARSGAFPVWHLVGPGEMRDSTLGGFLEMVCEFELPAGGLVRAHAHATHEFYYVTSGRGVMTVGDDQREINQGDLVYIAPHAYTASAH